MKSTFNSSRIFNDQDGWYVVMRASDIHYLKGARYKCIGQQHLMGPFLNKDKVEDWLSVFIALHGENRHSTGVIQDNADRRH